MDESTSQSINWTADQLTERTLSPCKHPSQQSINRTAVQPIDQATEQSIKQSLNGQVKQLNEQQTDRTIRKSNLSSSQTVNNEPINRAIDK